jgi:hypothetical protein
MNGDKLHRAVDHAIHAAFGESVKVLEAPVKLSHLSPLLADTKLHFRSPIAAALDIMCRKEICGDRSQVCDWAYMTVACTLTGFFATSPIVFVYCLNVFVYCLGHCMHRCYPCIGAGTGLRTSVL